MFKKLRWPALLLTMLMLLTPSSALAKKHREHRHHVQVGFYVGHGPSYHHGYYDRWGYWHPYGYYDRWGYWHPYRYSNSYYYYRY